MMIRRVIVALTTAAVAVGLVGSTTLADPTAPRHAGTTTIALVNEDEAAAFNGTDYRFGAEFVDLVAGDSRYDWRVVSRSVAENAYANDAVNAVIYLPRTFSHDLLTLEELDPVSAVVDYKILTARTGVSRRELEDEIVSVLRDFNTRVVKMYFASIAGTISEAQVAMDSVVGTQSTLVSSLSDSVYPDLTTAHQGYDGSVNLATALQSMNTAWIAAQNSFTESTTRTLTGIGSSIEAEQPRLTDFFALQRQIAETNAVNGNAAIDRQHGIDEDFYDAAFSAYTDRLLAGADGFSGLAGLSSTNGNGKRTGALATLEQAIAGYDTQAIEYNDAVARTTADLRGQQDSLTSALRELESLETRLLGEYFAYGLPEDNAALGIPGGETSVGEDSYDIDPSAFTPERARTALAEKLAHSFSTGSAASAPVAQYEQTVRDLVAKIPTEPAQYARLFGLLESRGVDPARYTERLALIRSYAASLGIGSPTLNVLSAPADPADQTVTKSLSVRVPAGARYLVTFALPDSLSAADVSTSVGSPAPACAGAGAACVDVDPGTGSVVIDNSSGSETLTVVLDYVVHLRSLTGATLSFSARDLSLPAAPETELARDVYALVPADVTAESLGGTDFGAITSTLSDIDTASTLLLFLYGSPGEDLGAFAGSMQATPDFAGHSAESVRNRYGTVDSSTIADYLSAADVTAFQSLGLDNIRAVIARITDLRTAIATIASSIGTLSALHLTDGYFSTSVAALEQWFASAMTAVTAEPARWEANTTAVIPLPVLPWQDKQDEAAALYLDEETGPTLYDALTRLIASTSTSAAAVAQGARAIADNTEQFTQLVASVTATKADTQAVLDVMGGTVSTGKTDVAASSDYSRRFSTVLANTRADGADTENIYDTFANPITAKDTTPTASAAGAGVVLDYRWAAVFLAGSLIGGLLVSLVGRRRRARRGTS